MTFKRKLLSTLTAGAMVAMVCAPAYAGTINTPVSPTETYTAYQIFDVTKSGAGFAYSIDKNSPWVSVLQGKGQTWVTLALAASGEEYKVTWNESTGNDAAGLAAYLEANKGSITGTELAQGENTVDNGYYLVTSSRGSALALSTTDIPLNIAEKNTYPSITKEANVTTASIGDTINYTINLTVPSTVNKVVTVHDDMEDGLTMGADPVAKVGEEEITYTKGSSSDDCDFELNFAAADVAGETITITYSATLNENAVIHTNDVIDDDDTNDNSAWVTYSGFTSTPQTVRVSTYQFDLVKTDGQNNVITGAKFKLQNNAGVEIAVVKDGDVYRPAVGNEQGVAIEAGQATIKGLAAASYKLVETVAPEGYNILTEAKTFTIADSNLVAIVNGSTYTSGGVQVINNTGTELPSTGGMGTTIFYIIGGMLVAAAGVTLVVRRRSRED